MSSLLDFKLEDRSQEKRANEIYKKTKKCISQQTLTTKKKERKNIITVLKQYQTETQNKRKTIEICKVFEN
jgi:hypothetical protein